MFLDICQVKAETKNEIRISRKGNICLNDFVEILSNFLILTHTMNYCVDEE